MAYRSFVFSRLRNDEELCKAFELISQTHSISDARSQVISQIVFGVQHNLGK